MAKYVLIQIIWQHWCGKYLHSCSSVVLYVYGWKYCGLSSYPNVTMSGIYRSVEYAAELKWVEVFEMLKYYKLTFYSKTVGLELQWRPMVRPCNRSLESKYLRSWYVKREWESIYLMRMLESGSDWIVCSLMVPSSFAALTRPWPSWKGLT